MNNCDVLKISEVADLLGVTERAVYKRIDSGQLQVEFGKAPKLGGKRPMLVALSSLPEEVQMRHIQKTFTESQSSDEPKATLNLVEVPESMKAEAMRRMEICQQAVEISNDHPGGRLPGLQELAIRYELHVSTLYSWMKAFRREGFPGLIPGWGKKRGTFTALSMALQGVIRDEYLQPTQPSPTTVYRVVQELCAQLGQQVPSLTTVNRFLLTVPRTVKVMHREGRKAWRSQMEPKCFRDLNASAPNEWWCGDHRIMDVFVRLSEDPESKIFRPWLTAWFDLGTRTAVGWHVALVPNSDTIAMALRKGMLRYGIPQFLYIDNGKDYRCHYLNGKTTVSRNVGLDAQIDRVFMPGVLNPLGVGVHHANPYQGWSKPIEPWFGHTFPEWEKALPGYCGSSPKQRPEKLQAEIRRGELLTLAAFQSKLAERLDDYHATEHSTLHATPQSKWEGVNIEIPNPRALDLLLMRHKPVTVYAQGIKLFSAKHRPRYYTHPALDMLVGHKVDVRYDPQEIGRLYVFNHGQFICEAENQEALKMGASQEDMKKLHRRKKQAERQVMAYTDSHRELMNPDDVLNRVAEERQQQKVVNLDVQPPNLISPQAGTVHKTANTPFDFAAKRITLSRAATPSVPPATGSMATRPGRAGAPSTPTSPAPLRRLTSVREPQAGDSGPSGEGLTHSRQEVSMDSQDVLSEFVDFGEVDRVPSVPPLSPLSTSEENEEFTMEDFLDE